MKYADQIFLFLFSVSEPLEVRYSREYMFSTVHGLFNKNSVIWGELCKCAHWWNGYSTGCDVKGFWMIKSCRGSRTCTAHSLVHPWPTIAGKIQKPWEHINCCESHQWWKWKLLRHARFFVAPYGLYNPWNSPGQNTGVRSLSLLKGIFPTQVSCTVGRFFTNWAIREEVETILYSSLCSWFLVLSQVLRRFSAIISHSLNKSCKSPTMSTTFQLYCQGCFAFSHYVTKPFT